MIFTIIIIIIVNWTILPQAYMGTQDWDILNNRNHLRDLPPTPPLKLTPQPHKSLDSGVNHMIPISEFTAISELSTKKKKKKLA